METPSKQPVISSMTHEEHEEMQHDISKLWDQVQQISLSQKVTKAKNDGLKKGVESSMNGVEYNMNGVQANMDGMEAKMNDMDAKMEYLKEGLTKLLQECFLMAKCYFMKLVMREKLMSIVILETLTLDWRLAIFQISIWGSLMERIW